MFRSAFWRFAVCVGIPCVVVSCSVCAVLRVACAKPAPNCAQQPCVVLDGPGTGMVTASNCYYWEDKKARGAIYALAKDDDKIASPEVYSTQWNCDYGDCTSECSAGEIPAKAAIAASPNCSQGAYKKRPYACTPDS